MSDTVVRDAESVFTADEEILTWDDKGADYSGQMKDPAAAPARYMISKALVLFVVATVAVLFGSVQAWVWPFYTALIYMAFIVFAWQRSLAGSVVAMNGYTAALGLFYLLTLFACLPLSDGFIGVLSPVRRALLRQASDLTGLDAGWSTLSYAPYQSLGWWAFLLGMGLLYVMLKHFFSSQRMLTCTLWVLLGVAVVEGVYGILQALLPNLGVLWASHLASGLGDARGTWVNRNHFAGFMGMMLPLMLGYTFSRVRWGAHLKFKTLLESDWIHQHGMFLLALVMMMLALLFSKSRAGIMATFLGVGIFLISIKGRDRKLPRRFWVLVWTFAGLTALYGVRIGLEPIFDRFLALGQGISRLDYWRDSLAIIADHPLGTGLATFRHVFPVYNVTSLSEMVTPHYLHNDMLQLLVETGWIGFFLIVGTVSVFMIDSFRRICRMDFYVDPLKFFVGLGAFSGLVGIFFHSLFDFNMQIPANAIYAVVLLAVLRVCSQAESYR